MAKLVTIQLLVNEDDEAHIFDGVNAVFEDMGRSADALIIDHRFMPGIPDVSAEINEAIASNTYQEGTAFGPTGTEQDLYLLVMEGDVSPDLQGPFQTDEQRTACAIQYRKDYSDDDGLYRLDVPRGTPITVGTFDGMELVENQLAKDLYYKLKRGETPIERLATGKYFEYELEGEQVLIDEETVDAIEEIAEESLVIQKLGVNDYMILESNARARVSKDEWQEHVGNGSTESSFYDWRENRLSELVQASTVFTNGLQG